MMIVRTLRRVDSRTPTPSAGEPDAARDSTSVAQREGTRTPAKHESSSERPQAFSVEVLAAYSHTVQAADLWLCHTAALANRVYHETERAASGEPVRRQDPSLNVAGRNAPTSY
jgi:hypothetical protein